MRIHAIAFAAVLACATPAAARGPRDLAAREGPYTLELVDDAGRALPTYQQGGRTYVLGALGERYRIRVRNASPRRVEVVVSVDGRDAVDGKPAAWSKRGYLVEPWREVTVDGYRLDLASVAAFRFATVPRSYASRMGDDRDVGVVGVALFRERERPRPPPIAVAPRDDAPRAEAGASAAPAESLRRSAPSQPRPGLGTEFGEQVASAVSEVPFERASARPDAVLALRYDDRDGLLALGIDVDRTGRGETALRESATPFRRDGWAAPPPGWTAR